VLVGVGLRRDHGGLLGVSASGSASGTVGGTASGSAYPTARTVAYGGLRPPRTSAADLVRFHALGRFEGFEELEGTTAADGETLGHLGSGGDGTAALLEVAPERLERVGGIGHAAVITRHDDRRSPDCAQVLTNTQTGGSVGCWLRLIRSSLVESRKDVSGTVVDDALNLLYYSDRKNYAKRSRRPYRKISSDPVWQK